MKHSDLSQTDEQVFADAVDELANRLDQGEPVDIDLYARRFPRLAERLRNAFDSSDLRGCSNNRCDPAGF